MLQIEYELKKMCREHRAGGRTTQADRLELAVTVGHDLDACGYHRFSRQKNCSRKLKDKHVRGLVEHWTGKGLSPGTINNRLAFLRHVCDWTGRGGVMSKKNADYHDGKRVREATVSKAAYVGTEVLNRVRNRYAQASLRLQVAFGLRRKEALMIQPAWADRGNRLVLQDTWTKGGRRREIPLTTAAQRQALDHAKAVAGKGSLIPPSLSYKSYRDGLWQTACRSIGLTGTHGFRHAYAQDRFEALAGFACPVRGGPSRDEMTAEQLQLDEWARGRVSAELGHGRLRVVEAYCGRGLRTDGQIEARDVRAAAGVAQGPGAGGRGKRHQRAGGRISDSAGSPGASRQRPGAEAFGPIWIRWYGRACDGVRRR